MIPIPFIISFCIGYFLIGLLFSRDRKIDLLLHLFLAGGLGLAVSACLTCLSFILFDQFNRPFILAANLCALTVLILFSLFSAEKRGTPMCDLCGVSKKDWLWLFLIGLFFIPLCLKANVYPLGGWDAWSAWNLKARFLFLGGTQWENLFDPLLWRASPHYPLLLPLINVWGWSFFKLPVYEIPYITSVLFTFFTAGLMFAGLRGSTRNPAATVAVLLVMSSSFFITLAGSQYSDIVFGYFLLGSVVCLLRAHQDNSRSFALLAGIFAGILSSSKSEGTIAALIIAFLAVPYLSMMKRSSGGKGQKLLPAFLAGAAAIFLPAFIFLKFYAPANQTFINGLMSASHPSDMNRLKIIGGFLLFELISAKWNGLWILLGAGLLLSWGKCFRKELLIAPVFLFSYLFIVGAYYWVNTHFEIGWWLQVSLDRILFALLPTIIFWVFAALWRETA